MKKVIIGLGLTAVCGGVGFFGANKLREAPARASFENLRLIGRALGGYVADSDGWVPPYHTRRTAFSRLLNKSEPEALVESLTGYGAKPSDFLPPGELPQRALDDLEAPKVCGYPVDPFLYIKRFTSPNGSLHYGAGDEANRPYLADGLVEAPSGTMLTRYGSIGSALYPDGEVRFERFPTSLKVAAR